MFGLGSTELIIILIIILVLFGPSQLPKIGKMLGQTTKSLREGMEAGAEDADPKAKKKTAKKAVNDNAEVDTSAADEEDETE